MNRRTFPKDFIWGTATASYQVEGAYNEQGRGVSIWDTFSRTPGKVLHGHTGDVASDQFHRYKEDVGLMQKLGVGYYRFSVAWPRVFPDGEGKQNPQGFDYYNSLVDSLLEAGIKPAVTLYHWDLPQKLQDQGGWTNRKTATLFADYAEACYQELGDRVDMWITLNEPFCASVLGYYLGVHAPGIKDRGQTAEAIHHLHLAHGMALERFRQGGYKGKIGITLNLNTPRPATLDEKDLLAADRAADLGSRMFMDPIFKGTYPQRFIDAYSDIKMPIEEGDLELVSKQIDFLGLNYYTEYVAAYDEKEPEEYALLPSWEPKTDMGWYIVPEGFYRQLMWVHNNYDTPELYITENGCAQCDMLSDDGTRCHDYGRIHYLESHFGALLNAIEDGVNLKGYFLWSLMDNFEWAYGYSKRFGIIYVDYINERRVPKDSYYFYRDVIAGHKWL